MMICQVNYMLKHQRCYTLLLTIALCYKPGLVSHNMAILSLFVFENPFCPNRVTLRRRWNQNPNQNPVHDECYTSHVTTGLKKCKECKQYKHLRYKTENREGI